MYVAQPTVDVTEKYQPTGRKATSDESIPMRAYGTTQPVIVIQKLKKMKGADLLMTPEYIVMVIKESQVTLQV